MTKKTNTKHVEKNNEPEKNPVHELVGNVFGNNAPTKMVDKSLEKIGIKSDTISETVELGKEISSDNEKKSLKQRITGGLTTLAGGMATALIGREVLNKKETEVVGKTAGKVVELYGNKEANDALEKMHEDITAVQKKHADKIQLENPNLSAEEAATKAEEKLDALKEKYGGKTSGMDVLGNAWDATATNKDGESRSWFGRAFAFFPALFKEYGAYKLTKKLQEEKFWEKKERFKTRKNQAEKDLNDFKKSAKEVGKEANKKAGQAKKVNDALKRSGVRPALKLIKNNNEVATKYIKVADELMDELEKGKISPVKYAQKVSENYQKSIAKLTEKLQHGKITPDKFATMAENVLEDTKSLAGKNKKTQEAFLKLIKNKKVPGMKLNKSIGKLSKIPVGSIGVASAINISIVEAIQAGEFSQFFTSLTSAETLKEAFVPGYGTYNSFLRAKNTDDPWWLTGLDVGINIAGDAVLTAGYIGSIFSAGGTGVAGVAARGGIAAFGKRILSKISLKQARKAAFTATKKGVRSSILMSPFTAGLSLLSKKFSSEEVEKVATKAYVDTIQTDEEKRTVKILRKISGKKEKTKKHTSSSKLTLEPGGKRDIEKGSEAA